MARMLVDLAGKMMKKAGKCVKNAGKGCESAGRWIFDEKGKVCLVEKLTGNGVSRSCDRHFW
ncbi:hypothetical protein ACWM35_20190 [Neobacillus sp. K501]